MIFPQSPTLSFAVPPALGTTLNSITTDAICQVQDYAMTKRGLVSIDRTESVKKEDAEDLTSGLKPVFTKVDLILKNVLFVYHGRKSQVLKGVTIRAKSGQMVAVVGASGGGKSTISKLILRLIEADEGKIFANGIDISQINLRCWRECVAYVPQNATLSNATVWENIVMGKPSASREEVEAAAKAAGAYGFIQKLSNGFEEIVGKNGVRLSGGQVQRIILARAFLRNPLVWVFDEPTSALDSETESHVQEAIERLRKEGNKTIIIIAHRLSTIVNSDYIYVLSEGRIAEEGTHAELFAKEGIYTGLCKLQSF